MKTVIIPNGFLHINESKADCPYCGEHVDIGPIGLAFSKTKRNYITWHCNNKSCGNLFGITANYKGDYVSYKLK